MAEPFASPDPSSSSDQPGGYATPHQQPPPDFGGVPMDKQPPPSAYPPQGMAGQPGPFSPAEGRQLTSDEQTWSMLAHLGGIVLGFLAPLIVMLTKGNESPYTRRQSVEALNFQITLIIAWFVVLILTLVSFGILAILFLALWVVDIVFCIIGGIAANKGQEYRYPLTLRLVT